ncbi:MAG: recombinase family protein, partial [Candidatus Omnitrophota bacterium]
MHPTTKDNAINCAVYTRVSVDERAETQTYSTLDNQRDSCIAYIESQKSLGWKVFKVYEDAGQSGGS